MNRKQKYSFTVAFVCIILMAIMVLFASIKANAETNIPQEKAAKISVEEVLVGIPDKALPTTTTKAEETALKEETRGSKAITDAAIELIEEAQEKTVTEIVLAEEAEEAEADESYVTPLTPEAEHSDADAKEEANDELEEFYWDGPVLNSYVGVVEGPSGKETYYNLPMDGVIYYMRQLGFTEEEYPYHVREDGCKMLGDYIMVAANLDLRPKGTIVKTSLGWGIVADTGGFAANNRTQLDIAVDW